jgi:glycine reductase complex component B subunit gamma
MRVGHYLNQFFAGVGGEEHANHPAERREGPVGPGRVLQAALKESGAVVSTLLCGDNFFNEQPAVAHGAVRAWLGEVRPDLVVAGPAFAAGRYGSACVEVCRLAGEAGIAAVTGMHPENPGRLLAPRVYAVPTAGSAADMPRALPAMLALGRKLAAGAALGPADVEGYLPRGVRRPGLRDAPGAERAVAMLVAKLGGRPFRTEMPADGYEAVPPAPAIRDLKTATLGLVTSGGVVPRGNPDHLRRCSETRWQRYDLTGVESLRAEAYECVHGGFYNQMACEDPNLVLPLDVVRRLEREGAFAKLLDFYCGTVGNDQRLLDCKRNGAEIAAALHAERAGGVLLVAT